MDQLEGLIQAVRGRTGEMLANTRAWVEINSYTENVAGVNAVGARLREAFALPSLTCEVKKGRLGDHILWSTPAAWEASRRILLVGHHDTVFPPGHFEGWREEGGRATGPGALDMKGGLAIIAGVLATLEGADALAGLPLVVASVADEEIGSPDSQHHLLEAARGASCALVFESGRANDLIVTQRRGTGAVKVVAEGRAAHAGNAHKDGINAIWAIACFIDAAQHLTEYPRGMTVNVGLVKGGTSKNTVPAQAECACDLRFESVKDAEGLIASLRTACVEAERAVPGSKLRLEGGANRLPMERTEASGKLYEEYAACARASGLGAGEAGMVGGGSDANTVSAVGVPAIDALGPRGAGFHTTSEYVETASFAPKAEALLRFLWGRRA